MIYLSYILSRAYTGDFFLAIFLNRQQTVVATREINILMTLANAEPRFHSRISLAR